MKQAVAARALTLALACLVSLISLKRGLQMAEARQVNNIRPSRMNMLEAYKYGLLEYRLAHCPLPEFVADNSDLFNTKTNELNIRDVVKYWKLLHKQMKLRYGSDELDHALAGMPSRVHFDEVDRVFFELREYILCLATANN